MSDPASVVSCERWSFPYPPRPLMLGAILPSAAARRLVPLVPVPGAAGACARCPAPACAAGTCARRLVPLVPVCPGLHAAPRWSGCAPASFVTSAAALTKEAGAQPAGPAAPWGLQHRLARSGPPPRRGGGP